MSKENWEQLGRAIANNTHLTKVILVQNALNDQKTSFLFKGLTRSSSIEEFRLHSNELRAARLRSMVPFLQNANNLTCLGLDGNNLQSEGFNVLLRTLSDSPIERLYCRRCTIELIQIDTEHIPRQLKLLCLGGNVGTSEGFNVLFVA